MAKQPLYPKIGLIANILLLILKGYFGFISGSLALLSDALNSFTDVLASLGILVAVKEGKKRQDSDHHYGHYAAEPLSAFAVAILAIILAFEIFKDAIQGLFFPTPPVISVEIIAVVIFTLILKSVLYFYFKKIEKKEDGQAVKAYIMDSKNDVGVSLIVLIGVLGTFLNYPVFDDLAALFVSIYIFKNAFDLGRKNIDLLMGKAPEKSMLRKIKKKALKVRGVKAIGELKAHYFGEKIHVGIAIKLNKKLNVEQAHVIEENVQKTLKTIKEVSDVDVHIEPF